MVLFHDIFLVLHSALSSSIWAVYIFLALENQKGRPGIRLNHASFQLYTPSWSRFSTLEWHTYKEYSATCCWSFFRNNKLCFLAVSVQQISVFLHPLPKCPRNKTITWVTVFINFVIINMKLTFSLTLSSSQFVCDLMI